MDKRTKAPWKDFNGSDIHVGDTIIHPSGESGIVRYYKRKGCRTGEWFADYGDGADSRLSLQIGGKGMGVVEK